MRKPVLVPVLALLSFISAACDQTPTEPSTSEADATVQEWQGESSLSGDASGFNAVATNNHAGRMYRVEQGGESFCVTGLSNGESVEDFYGYRTNHSHTSTDIERSNVSNLFLYEGSQGTSLVVLHDEPNDAHGTDSGGGVATFTFTGLPTSSGQWVVQDGEEGDFSSSTDASPDWLWLEEHADGGAWRGGLDSNFTITVDPAFNQHAQREPLDNPELISDWHVLSGDASAPDRISIALDQPVTISAPCLDIDVGPPVGGPGPPFGGPSVPAETCCGDVNRDGDISYADAALILKYLAGEIDDEDLAVECADVNGDGSVTTADASYLSQYLAGVIDELNCS